MIFSKPPLIEDLPLLFLIAYRWYILWYSPWNISKTRNKPSICHGNLSGEPSDHIQIQVIQGSELVMWSSADFSWCASGVMGRFSPWVNGDLRCPGPDNEWIRLKHGWYRSLTDQQRGMGGSCYGSQQPADMRLSLPSKVAASRWDKPLVSRRLNGSGWNMAGIEAWRTSKEEWEAAVTAPNSLPTWDFPCHQRWQLPGETSPWCLGVSARADSLRCTGKGKGNGDLRMKNGDKWWFHREKWWNMLVELGLTMKMMFEWRSNGDFISENPHMFILDLLLVTGCVQIIMEDSTKGPFFSCRIIPRSS